MYLYKKTVVKNWNHMKPEEKYSISVKKNKKSTHIQTKRISEVVEDIGYWRKANAIHKWFVDNVQNGLDDCKEYYVERDALRVLLGKVQQVLREPEIAPNVLPTESGFFFGSTDYDEYYFEDLKHTEKLLKDILAEPEGGSIYYHSSW